LQFLGKKKDNKDRNKKRVDTDALKEVIDDTLVKKETNNGNYNQEKSKKERGFLKPGQKVRFD